MLLTFVSLILYGCTDNSLSTVHSKTVLKQDISCMRLLVFPPNQSIENDFNKLYPFDKICDLDLHISYKNSIVCNSEHNSNHKAHGMAKSYLRLELKKERKLLYSYYVDLDEDIKSKDIEDGFERMRDTLPFKAK